MPLKGKILGPIAFAVRHVWQDIKKAHVAHCATVYKKEQGARDGKEVGGS